MYLYEEIEQAKKYGAYAALPSIIPENLSAKFELRHRSASVGFEDEVSRDDDADGKSRTRTRRGSVKTASG